MRTRMYGGVTGKAGDSLPTYVDWCTARLPMWHEIVRGKRRNFPLFVDELAALHGEVDQVSTQAVFQIPIVAGVENQQIGGLAGFQGSHLFGAAQRVSAVDGSRANRSEDRRVGKECRP